MLKSTILLSLVVMMITGCEAEEVAVIEPIELSDSAGKSDGAWVELEDGSRVPSVVGTYHVMVEQESRERDLETGEEVTKFAEVHVLTTVTQTGGNVSLNLDFCDLIVPETGGKEPYFDTGTIRNLPSYEMNGQLELQTEENTEDYWAVVTDPGYIVMGANLEDASVQSLPTDSDDPAVFDSDQDGNPGATMYIKGYPFRIFLGLKAEFSFKAALYADSRYWQGDTDMSLDTVIYGDDIPFVDVAGQLEAAEERTEVFFTGGTATFIRLDGTTTPTCDNMVSISRFETHALMDQPPVGADLGSGSVDEFVEDDWDGYVLDEELPADDANQETETEVKEEEAAD